MAAYCFRLVEGQRGKGSPPLPRPEHPGENPASSPCQPTPRGIWVWKAASSWEWAAQHQCPAPEPTCKGWCQAAEAVWLLQLSVHLLAVSLVLAQDGTALLQAPQCLEGLKLVLQYGFHAADVVGQLHGHEGEDLCQVVLEDITNDTIPVVEADAA